MEQVFPFQIITKPMQNLKAAIWILTVRLILFLPEDTTGSQSSDLKGDVNLNGTIEIADVVLLNKHLIKASVLKDQALKSRCK